MLTLEHILIRVYRTALEDYIASPFSEPARLAFFGARDDLAEFIREDGAPAEDLEAGVQYRVTRTGAILTGPLYRGRLSAWHSHGADSVAPGYKGVS